MSSPRKQCVAATARASARPASSHPRAIVWPYAAGSSWGADKERQRTGKIAKAGCLVIVASRGAVVTTLPPACAQEPRKPNILVIMGDDVGWFNIGAYHRGIMS